MPGTLRVIPGSVFCSFPALLGVEVVDGVIGKGDNLYVLTPEQTRTYIGSISRMQLNHVDVDAASKDDVAVIKITTASELPLDGKTLYGEPAA